MSMYSGDGVQGIQNYGSAHNIKVEQDNSPGMNLSINNAGTSTGTGTGTDEEYGSCGSRTNSNRNGRSGSYSGNGERVRRPKRFKKIACTECRQQKAKCDASDKQPGPCTRCQKRNIPCRLDGEFKRTFKRAKIDELVKEYEIIKSRLQVNPNSNPDGAAPKLNLQPLQQQHHQQTFPQTQFLPPLPTLQRSQTFTSQPTPLPDPNIFHPVSLGQGHSGANTLASAGATPNTAAFLSTITNIPHSPSLTRSFSPVQVQAQSMIHRTNSPLGLLSASTNQFVNGPAPTSTSTSTNTNINNTNTNTNASTTVSGQPNGMSRIGSPYNLSTLISAANVSERGINSDSNVITNKSNSNTDNAVTFARANETAVAYNSSSGDPITKDGDTQIGTYAQWRAENRPVRKPKINNILLECTPKTLGDVTMTEDQIVLLYTTFVTYYHPLLPVIDIEKGIEKIYRLCPVLFWTIMFTALRGHHSLLPVITEEESQSLYFKLSPILKSVLAEITISPITRYAPSEVDEPILNASSVYSVQAFLIYTFWPPLTSSLSADSSWNTIGIAFYQAIRIGLHTPGMTSDRVRLTNKDLMNEQIRTWIACNIVSQTIASVFGFPGFFQPYGSLSLSSTLNGDEIPHCLRQMLEIQNYEEQVEKTLNNNSFDPLRLNKASERLPLIQLLENELNQLELRLCSYTECTMDDFRVLALYTARLHLLSYNFLDEEGIPSFELKKGLIKTYNAALAIIQHCKNSQERDQYFVHGLPSSYILTIWQASVVIGRLINSRYKTILDVTTGRQLYQVAIHLAMKASVIKHDLAYRSCGIMKSTWNLFKTLDEAEPEREFKVDVRSRMSANIFFDTLWTLREKCGMIQLNPSKEKTGANAESAESDSDVEVIDDEEAGELADGEDTTPDKSSGKPSVESRHISRTPEGVKESRAQSKDSCGSFRRKPNYHPESAARRIINTIPLDPQPIALAETPKDSDGSSKQPSPAISNYKSPNNSNSNAEMGLKKIISPQNLVAGHKLLNSHNQNQIGSDQNGTEAKSSHQSIDEQSLGNANTYETTHGQGFAAATPSSVASAGANLNVNMTMPLLSTANGQRTKVADTNAFMADGWDIGAEFDTAMLFKDIESVMDEFGFHAE
jgi:transcriptional regulatory protein LEU3